MQTRTKLIRTSTFRLAAAYLVLFALSVGAILAYVYWNTAVLLERQIDDTIRAEVNSLAEQYATGRLTRVLQTVRLRSERGDDGIYLMTDPLGRPLAGNLQALPAEALQRTGWIEFPYTVETAAGVQHHEARAYRIRLDAGFTLLVGRDVQQRRDFAALIRRTLFWAIGLTILLGLAGGYLMSRNFLNRIDSISRTAHTIMEGDLSGRMPVTGTGDEIDRLSQSLNEMLERIERLMTGMKDVSTNIAHDLKTPLTRLRARTEDALRSSSPASHREALEQTLSDADHLLGTFNALLSIARAEARHSREGFAEIDAAALIRDLAELYSPLVEEGGGTLETVAEGPLTIRADRQLLSQAITNLIDNALKHGKPVGDEPPRLVLSASRENDKITIAVTDNGCGVERQDRARVVERFVRLDKSRSTPGNGLGLSLAASIIHLHDGRLELEDAGPGLKASLTLPASATNEELAPTGLGLRAAPPMSQSP